jgi:uncharacterized protein
MTSIRCSWWVLVFFLVAVSGRSEAASFDCARAESHVEKLVCSDPEVSALDERLGRAFLQSRQSNKNVTIDQRRWLSSWRDTCVDINCLKKIYIARIDELANSTACPVSSASLVGHWQRASGQGIEQIYLGVEAGQGVFTTWLHNSPESTGKWAILNCAIELENSSNRLMNFRLRVLKATGDQITLRDEDEGDVGQYRQRKSAR